MQTSDLAGHISKRFNKDLEELRNSVMTMGGLVETQLSKAISAIVSGDSEVGLKVAHDDYKVNLLEVEIDEECGRILATRAPAAGDLRLIVAIIKTITDLERVGDEAEKIGYLASKLATMDRPPDSYRELKNLGNHVLHMLRGAMNAFARLDVRASYAVVREDELV
ncbi:MAG: phosphate signaling complex protein PhoU, partial [Woeseiaceae bacterium]